MKINPYQQYKETQFQTASREKLILMLYDGAIRNLHQAQRSLKEGNFEGTNNNLTKAQDIINELMVSLNLDVGEIAHNLYQLYDYMRRRLIMANTQKKEEPIKEVLGMLKELRDVWKEAMLKVQKNKAETRRSQGGVLLEG